MATCWRCGQEQILPQQATRMVEINRFGFLFIFYQIFCQSCKFWLEDRLHPDSESKPVVPKAA